MILLQLFFAASAFIQIVGIASIAPFIGIISNPSSIQSNRLLASMYNIGGFQSNDAFIYCFAILSIAMIIISNGVSALSLWIQLKFSIYLGSHLQYQLFNKFIHREYLFHKSTNYNKLISIITNEAPRFIYMVLQPYLLMCSQAFVALIIMISLLMLNPVIAIGAALLIGGAYLGTYWSIKRSLKSHGNILIARNRSIQALLSETFIGIKDVKLNSLEAKYSANYNSLNQHGLDSSAYVTLSGDLPRFAIETISFSAILIFAIYLLSTQSSSENAISILSIYAIAGYKLLPTMQQIYKSISSISANGAVTNELKATLNHETKSEAKTHTEPMLDIREISLENLSYQYPNARKLTLDNISVSFAIGQLNTIAGPSGSGKSTLADLVLGLLIPESGVLRANQCIINDATRPAYQHSLGYVPQHIFILDDNITANVAFGVDKGSVNLEKVKQALIQANAMEFVDNLPQGLETNLGQDGKLLSGGQRQRIGIARALYRSNRVLILDEPTSALDIESEHELMQLLNQLKHQVLIIVISHRPAAIKLSDKICVIADGKLIADGNYTTLLNENSYFKSMINKGFMNGNHSPPSSSFQINSGQVPLNKQSSASPAPTPYLLQVDK